jgi:chemotaxis family two-component system response regulator Rcp1
MVLKRRAFIGSHTERPAELPSLGAKMTFEILVVEDNPMDVELVREALRGWKTPSNVHVVENGDDALSFLRRVHPYRCAPVPNLILLDLNLPKKSGLEVLEEIKNNADFSRIPVIVLTTSDREADVSQAYMLHANCYLTKSLEISIFFEKVRAIEEFWLNHARLPRA